MNRPSTDAALADAGTLGRGRTVLRSCLSCEAPIRTYRSRVANGKDKYCSRACYAKAQRFPMVTLACQSCGEPFEIAAHHRQRNRRYCGQRCHGKDTRGARHATWKGGVAIIQGYRCVYVPEGQRADHVSHRLIQGRYIQEHVLIAERALGRCLVRHVEEVHHINGDKLDNRPSNLLICTKAYHKGLHARMAYLYQREKFGGVA